MMNFWRQHRRASRIARAMLVVWCFALASSWANACLLQDRASLHEHEHQGTVRLIGATTHNPGFYVNPPLLSRSHLFRLEPLAASAVAGVLRRALTDVERGLGRRGHTAPDKVLTELAVLCDGDLRRALNALEVIALSLPEQAAIGEKELEVFARERRSLFREIGRIFSRKYNGQRNARTSHVMMIRILKKPRIVN